MSVSRDILCGLIFCSFLLPVIDSAAIGFDDRTTIAASFESIHGEHGEFQVDSTSMLRWKNASVGNSVTSGFAYRKVSGNFILTVQLNKLDQSSFNFGLQINGANNFSARTQLTPQQNLSLISSPDHQLPILEQIQKPPIFRLERNGYELLLSAAAIGKPLALVARYRLAATQILANNTLLVGVYREFSTSAGELEIKDLRWSISSP